MSDKHAYMTCMHCRLSIGPSHPRSARLGVSFLAGTLTPPRQNSPLNLRLRHIPGPPIPEFNCRAVWLEPWLANPHPRRQQACVADNESFAYVQDGKQITEPSKAVREEPPNNRLIISICQTHCDHVVALTQNCTINLGRPLADDNQAHTILPTFLCDPFEDADRNVVNPVPSRSLRDVEPAFPKWRVV